MILEDPPGVGTPEPGFTVNSEDALVGLPKAGRGSLVYDFSFNLVKMS